MAGSSGPSSPTGARATHSTKNKDKRAGIAQAIDNADHWSFDSGLRLIHTLALAGRPFTSDNVAASGLVFDHPCRIGALFNYAHRAGIIRRLGYTPSTRNGRNGGVISIWAAGENAK